MTKVVEVYFHWCPFCQWKHRETIALYCKHLSIETKSLSFICLRFYERKAQIMLQTLLHEHQSLLKSLWVLILISRRSVYTVSLFQGKPKTRKPENPGGPMFSQPHKHVSNEFIKICTVRTIIWFVRASTMELILNFEVYPLTFVFKSSFELRKHRILNFDVKTRI